LLLCQFAVLSQVLKCFAETIEDSRSIIHMVIIGPVDKESTDRTSQRSLPHIHVKFQEQEAVVAIPSGDILEGSLTPNKLKLVQAWIEIHQDDLLADWELASAGESVFKIDPLK
jgi:hypothetical protein